MQSPSFEDDKFGSYNNLEQPSICSMGSAESAESGYAVEPEELEHTCLTHTILDKLDSEEAFLLDELSKIEMFREYLDDPTVQKILELLEYVNN